MVIENTEKKFVAYMRSLQAYLGNEIGMSVINGLGEDNIKEASFATTVDTGMAYEGAFLDVVMDITKYACQLNQLLPESKQVSKESIVKVGLLSHIAKVRTLIPNPNQWEVDKRGMAYTFAKTKGALRNGERSILIATQLGVSFNEVEYEAMRIMDKDANDDNYAKLYSSTLSNLIKMANEIIAILYKKEDEEN